MSKKWIISDLHLGCSRTYQWAGVLRSGSNTDEHDEWLINQINSVVKKGDLLYMVGDICMTEEAFKKLGRIKGQKILIRGNHDIYATQRYLEYFQQVHGLLKFKGTFWISHAPIHPQELRGCINIHGHLHQHLILLDGQPDPRYVNVSVERTFGVPQSLDDLFNTHKDAVYRAKKAIKEAKMAATACPAAEEPGCRES
jgi:calcineurin-like phosphoesterase family protein